MSLGALQLNVGFADVTHPPSLGLLNVGAFGPALSTYIIPVPCTVSAFPNPSILRYLTYPVFTHHALALTVALVHVVFGVQLFFHTQYFVVVVQLHPLSLALKLTVTSLALQLQLDVLILAVVVGALVSGLNAHVLLHHHSFHSPSFAFTFQ